MADKDKKSSSRGSVKVVALKGHIINQPPYYCVIKEGDDIKYLGVPERYLPNLIAEGVIKGDK